MIGYGQSGTTHDFFCYNAAGQVWNGSAFVTWVDGDYASYRVTATEVGTTGRFTGTAPSGTETYELRERGSSLALSYVLWTDDLTEKKLLEADRISVLSTGVYYERTLERGTETQLIPDKVIKQTDGATTLTNPITQRYGGSVQE